MKIKMPKLPKIKIGGRLSRIGMKVRKNSPEILTGIGLVGMFGGTVVACKQTAKLSDILDETKLRIEEFDLALEKGEVNGEEYTEKMYHHDARKEYLNTGIAIARTYILPAAMMAGSACCILQSHRIMSRRITGLTAAYAALDKTFGDYRSRVIDKLGEEADREFFYDAMKETVYEEEYDPETGETKEIGKMVEVGKPGPFVRMFSEYTTNSAGEMVRNYAWDPDPTARLVFLKCQQQWANDILRSRATNKKPGWLFLNEVLKQVGEPITDYGQYTGWLYYPDGNNPYGDNFVSFGIFESDDEYRCLCGKLGDEINPNSVLLNFNVDGTILDKI